MLVPEKIRVLHNFVILIMVHQIKSEHGFLVVSIKIIIYLILQQINYDIGIRGEALKRNNN